MANLDEDLDQLDLEARSYLVRAWLSAGRRDRAAKVLTDGLLQVATSSALGGDRITSAVRQRAVLLDALLDYNHGTVTRGFARTIVSIGTKYY